MKNDFEIKDYIREILNNKCKVQKELRKRINKRNKQKIKSKINYKFYFGFAENLVNF